MVVTHTTACPLREDLEWRGQLAPIAGPASQEATPPAERQVRGGAHRRCSRARSRVRSCCQFSGSLSASMPAAACGRPLYASQLKGHYTYACHGVTPLQGAVWDYYRALLAGGWKLDATGYVTAFR